MRAFFGILLILASLIIYFLPSIVGWKKRNAGAIIILNFLLGWTVIGWVVAMVWACTVDSDNVQKGSNAEEIERLAKLRDSGAITEDEFLKLKKNITK